MLNSSILGRRALLRALAAVCLVVLALGAVGCGKKVNSVTVPLKFRPTTQLNMNAFAGDLPDTTLHIGTVNDVRDNKEQVGENAEEDTPVPVFAGSEPVEFVHDTMRDLLTKAGLKVTEDPGQADRIVVTDLHRFWTRETNTYESEARATVTMNDRGGRQLWKGMINGTAKRFGKSLSAENYQEVFSDAMVNMVQQGLLDNAGFRAALKKDARPAANE